MANCPACEKSISDTTTRVGLLCAECQKARTSTPSPTSRAMMKTLADRLMFTMPTAAELVAAHTREALDALNAGDFARYAIATYAMTEAMQQITAIMREADPTARGIESLDPGYWETVIASCLPKQIALYRARLKNLDDLELVRQYLTHTLSCRTRRPVCAEHAAAVAELKSRGLEVPQ